ncbi:MAG: MBL fold metallo-hydrolase [Patescibacteria group bacterium]|nr:MBL fold metallo-hydrolase [Patescibacteria group bacterium]
MKKMQLVLLLILVIICGMIFFVKKNKVVENIQQVAGENITNSVGLKVTYLDVGQGDASFIEFPDGEQMLVDCAIDGRILEALGRVMPYYDHDIDYLLITHPDTDHYGGCTEVLNRFQVKNIVYSGIAKNGDQLWESFWEAIQNENTNYIEVKKEDVWNIASTTLHILYPDHSLVDNKNIPNSKVEANTNNTSIVFKLEFLDKNLLFMGDAEEELEKYLLATYGNQLDADVLKLGHHGSDSSSSEDFLKIVSPDEAIASCGLDNKFGHPSRRILSRLERIASSTIWRTDLQGDVFLNLDDSGLNMYTK